MKKISNLLCVLAVVLCAVLSVGCEKASAESSEMALNDLLGDYRVVDSYLNGAIGRDESKGLVIRLQKSSDDIMIKGVAQNNQGGFKSGDVVVPAVIAADGRIYCKVRYATYFKLFDSEMKVYDHGDTIVLKEIDRSYPCTWTLKRM